MKIKIFFLFIFLSSQSFSCEGYYLQNRKFIKAIKRIESLIGKNQAVFNKTSSPFKRVKISSNLVILNNKLEVIKSKKNKLKAENQECINEAQ